MSHASRSVIGTTRSAHAPPQRILGDKRPPTTKPMDALLGLGWSVDRSHPPSHPPSHPFVLTAVSSRGHLPFGRLAALVWGAPDPSAMSPEHEISDRCLSPLTHTPDTPLTHPHTPSTNNRRSTDGRAEGEKAMLAYLLKGSLGELLAPTVKTPQRRFLVRACVLHCVDGWMLGMWVWVCRM